MILNEQWGREWWVVFKNLNTGKVFQVGELRMEFDIELYVDQKEKANVGNVSIYNLSEATYKDMDCANGYIWVYAGYKGNSGLIAEGDVVNIATTKQGTDVITTFKLAEGFRDLSIKKVKPTTLPEGISVKEVVEYIAKDIGIPTALFTGDWVSLTMPYGYPVYGNAKQALDNICKAHNLEWKFLKGSLLVTDKYALINKKGETAIVLAKNSGMIEIPYRHTEKVTKDVAEYAVEKQATDRVILKKLKPKKNGQPRKTKKVVVIHNNIRVKALLNPNIKPNSLIRIESDETTLNGYYRVRSVIFKGDSRGQDWSMDIYGDSVDGKEVE